jgi:hypothetical protein
VKLDGGRRFGFIDKAGRLVIEPRYRDARPFREGRARVTHFGEPPSDAYIDVTGKGVFTSPGSPSFDFREGLARVQVRDKVGFVDKDGKLAIAPRFDGAGDFSDARASVRVDQRWGYVDAQGEFVVKPVYLEAGDFAEGVARVLTADKVRFVIAPAKSSRSSRRQDTSRRGLSL